MTEAEWLACEQLDAMLSTLRLGFEESAWVEPAKQAQWQQLEPLRSQISIRKLRLFVCACARRLEDRITLAQSRSALTLAEQVADGLCAEKDLAPAREELKGCLIHNRATAHAADRMAWTSLRRPRNKREGEHTASAVAVRLMYALTGQPTGDTPYEWEQWEKIPGNTELLIGPSRQVCDLIRHVLGNPFRPVQKRRRWPADVVGLAQAADAGEDAVGALHDALIDANEPVLAEHFAPGSWHPKGCWLVDAILNRR